MENLAIYNAVRSVPDSAKRRIEAGLSLIHISEPTRPY